ncbi:MAG TPA: aldehyde dehydrogenase family protein, partial [Mycobacterium sp.]|nr:aldehyde dehydrogenase family protein [Mycobacterium sp.]
MTGTLRGQTVAGSWIDGAAVETAGAPHRVVNPADGSVVAEVALATPADVDRAVASARAAFGEWSRATPAERSGVLGKLAELMERDAQTFIAEEVAQCGKP